MYDNKTMCSEEITLTEKSVIDRNWIYYDNKKIFEQERSCIWFCIQEKVCNILAHFDKIAENKKPKLAEKNWKTWRALLLERINNIKEDKNKYEIIDEELSEKELSDVDKIREQQTAEMEKKILNWQKWKVNWNKKERKEKRRIQRRKKKINEWEKVFWQNLERRVWRRDRSKMKR